MSRRRFEQAMENMRRQDVQVREDAFDFLREHADAYADELIAEFAAEQDDVDLRCRLLELIAEARSAKALEVLLDAHGAVDVPWEEKRNESWLQRYWKSIDLIGDHELYAAVVDETGRIVMHSDAVKIGQRLEPEWYERRVPEAGPDVVWSPRSALAADHPAYNVALPMNVGDRQIGEYHKGIDATWMESKIASELRKVRARWLWVIGLGFFFALGNLAILIAFAREGKASIITPLTALYPVVSIPLAILLLGEKISAREAIGIFFALGSVAALSWPASPGQPQTINNLQHEIHH